MSKVSIIVTVYNLEKYIDKCLSSIMEQSYQDFELIVVNNGSSDGSQSIIDKYVQLYSDKIKSIIQENLGVSGSRNTGLRNCTSKYIMFVDGDDFIGKDFLLALVNVAIKNDADMVFTKGYHKVDAENNFLSKAIFPPPILLFRVRGPWAHLYRREIIEKNKIAYPINCNYEDNYFNMAFELFGHRFFEADTMDYFYRVHQGSAVHTVFKYLNDVSFPYNSLTELFQKAKMSGKESYEMLEFNLLRFFTAVIMVNGKKADKAVLRRVCTYAETSLKTYFPDFHKNAHIRLLRYKNVSRKERIGMWLFAKLVKYNLLCPFALIYTRF